MADPITDERVAAVLRTFVRSCGPMLARLRRDDAEIELPDEDRAGDVDRKVLDRIKSRLGQLRYPGSESWAQLTVDERTDWWVNRVGRFTALAASVTGLAGALGDRLPLQDMLGSAGQGLLLCAIASEHGVDDRGTRVRMLAMVLFERDIDPLVAAGRGDDAADDAVVAQLTHELPAATSVPDPARGRRFGVKAAAKWLWRQGRLLLSVSDELGKRPHGRFYHRAMGKLPLVGMAGDYFGERSALKRAARAGHKWLHANAVPTLRTSPPGRV
ncbi:MAG TPA: hypothetical protein VH969_14860 [Actinophytocola sp.]|uniref:hypothetical protein n=1 Tax=Actinophytocola sp. TaxID=1872138 RepID=UPI002F9286E4